MKGKLNFFCVLAAIMFAAALAVAAVFEFNQDPQMRKDTVTILRGENAFQIAGDLKAEGYISSKIIFLAKVISRGDLKNLKAGEYDFDGLADNEIIERLVRARVIAKNFTVIPGWTVKDIAAHLQRKDFLRDGAFSGAVTEEIKGRFDFLNGLPAGSNLEGYLFPDTYQLPENADADGLATLILDNFNRNVTPDMRNRITAQKKTVYEIITMAAMLEKEVKTLEDKKIVAGILWKRLVKKMPLQVDSTILYVTGGKFDKELDSPYNTYKYPGLPAGPICNPGLESIEAAMEPIDSPYWFYLSAPDGTTIFSRDYGEHLSNKAKYLE